MEISKYVEDFNRDGFCILRGHIPVEKIKAWAKAFEPLLQKHILEQADPSFRGPQRFYVTLPFQAPFNDPEIFEDDLICSIVEKVAGSDFVMCQLASDTPLKGSDYQEIHADAPPLFSEEVIETPSFQLALNFALCDVAIPNGPTDMTRGTHRMLKAEALQKIHEGKIVIEPIEMKMGDVMLRDVRGLHRGTPNVTDIPRPMIVIGYSRKWLHRPEVSIRIPTSEYQKLSARAKHMLRFNPVVDDEEAAPPPESYKSFAY